MTWKGVWDDGDLEIQDAQFSLSKICRSGEYYVNSESTDILELGTKDHPFKSMNQVFSEILNYFFQIQRLKLMFLLKRILKLLLKMINNYVINITSVAITSYSDGSELSEKATLIPTDILQTSLSSKTAFNILQNTDLRLSEQITSDDIGETEKSLILSSDRTIIFW
jgi:hypothetical protein